MLSLTLHQCYYSLGRRCADGRAAEVAAHANTAYHSVTAADMRTAKAPAANAAARGNALYRSAAEVYPTATACSKEVDRTTAVVNSNTLFVSKSARQTPIDVPRFCGQFWL